jgi:ribose-phosphate pyrophosphokinase
MSKFIFSTNSNSGLAKKIASQSGLRFGKCEIAKYADQEIRVLIKEDIKDKEVYVLGSTFPPAENILEFLLLVNTLKINGASKISAIIPYLGYAKSDKVHVGGSLSAKFMAQTIELAGVDKIIVVNIHSKKTEGFFTIPVLNLSGTLLLSEHFKKLKIKNLAVVSPDAGGVSRAEDFAKNLGINEIVKIDKYRPATDQVAIHKIDGDVKNKNVVIVDDMIQTGGTLIKSAEALKKMGAKKIYVAVTHLVSTGPSIKLLTKEKNIDQIILTDAIPLNKNISKKFKKISIVPLIVEGLKK